MDKPQICRSATKISQLCSDVWLQIFQYFTAIELYSSFKNMTRASNEVLLNVQFHNQLRGLVVNSYITNLPEGLLLDQVISLTMQNETSFDIIQKCSHLRSLKLIGEPDWIITLIRKCSHKSVKFEQLSVVIPDVKPLYQLLACVLPITSLRRLEICADQLEERVKANTLSMVPSKIEQFILSTCSAITYNELACIQPGFIHVRYLNIGLFQRCRDLVRPFIFQYIRSFRASLLEVPFKQVNQLVLTMPNLVKLALTGLVDDENFIDSHKWLHLLRSVPTLLQIVVNISLQQNKPIFYCEKFHTALHSINLNLTCMVDDYTCYPYEEIQQRWWQLKGVIHK